jgi:hypothetical protein
MNTTDRELTDNELRDEELEQVAGGSFDIGNIVSGVVKAATVVVTPEPPKIGFLGWWCLWLGWRKIVNDLDHHELAEIELDAVSGADNKEFVEITEGELKQVTGGAKLPAMHKAPDVTLKRG